MTTIERMPLTRDELECAVWLTFQLVKMRQEKCEHLCVENIGPEIYRKLLAAYYPPLFSVTGTPDIGPIDLGGFSTFEASK